MSRTRTISEAYDAETALIVWASCVTQMPGANRQLTKTEKLVLVALATKALWHEQERQVYAQVYVADLAAAALCFKDSARRAARLLERGGLLAIIPTRAEDNGYDSNRYYFPAFEEAITGKPFVKPTFHIAR